MADDKKKRGSREKSGKKDQSDNKPARRVVTHHGKKRDSGLPDEIKPAKQGGILEDPIDLGVNPAKYLKTPIEQAKASKPEEPKPEKEADFMRESISPPAPVIPTQPVMSQQPVPNSSGHWFVSFAFLLSLATLGIVAVVSFVLYQTKQEVQLLKTDMVADKNTIDDLVDKAELALADVKTLQEKNDISQSDLALLKEEVENAQVKLFALTGKKDWVLNEVKSLVQNASQQILINKDVLTALSQLQLADQKLRDLGHPDLNLLRDALSQDIVKLKSVTQLDKDGLWAQLNAIVSQLPSLQFKTLIEENSSDEAASEPETEADTDKPKWQKALDKSWGEIKNLIRVSRYDQDQIQPVLAQHEKIQLLRAMQYMVEQAKWAVLKQDNLVYQEALNTLSQNMQLFFEKESVQENLLAEIEKVSEINIVTAQINISQSLQAVGEALSLSMEHNG